MPRDTGRTACYRAEGALDPLPQLDWQDLLAMAKRVVSDPVITGAYPELTRRVLKLKPRMKWMAKEVGHYETWSHRIVLNYGGRDAMTLLHEMAHAATPGAAHGERWRTAYVFIVWRILGEEVGRRLVAAFVNEQVLEADLRMVEPSLI